MDKIVNKFRNNIKSLGPSKCPVYVRFPWIGFPCQLIAEKVSSSVTRCYNTVMVQTTFTIWAAFHPIHKDVLHIFQQSNLIYKFKYRCNATSIGRTSHGLEVSVKQFLKIFVTAQHPGIQNCSIRSSASIWMLYLVVRLIITISVLLVFCIEPGKNNI